MNPNNLNYLDELVKEYLLFRGFTQTNHTFSIEKKSDKLKGFQVEKILDQINIYISNYDIAHVIELWSFLDSSFFSKIDYNRNNYGYGNNNNNSPFNQQNINQQYGVQSLSNYTTFRNSNDLPSSIKKLATSLKKYYVIYCVNNSKMDKVKEFFDLYSLELCKDPEWQHWFALPYIKNPQLDPFFEVYFTKNWTESFSLSLKNFLTTIFKNIPLPKILQFNLERQNRKRLEAQVENLLQQNEELRAQLDKFEYHNRRESISSKDIMANTSAILKKENSLNSLQNVNNDGFNSNEMNSFSRVSKRFEPRTTSASSSNINGLANDNDEDKTTVVIGIGRSRKSATNSISSGSTNQTSPSTLNKDSNNNSNINNNNTINNNNSNSGIIGLSQLTNSFEMSEIDENGFKKLNKNNNNSNSNNGEIIYTIDSQEVVTSHSSPVTRCKYLSNGSKIASSSVDGTVRLCSVDGFIKHTTIYCLSEVISLEWESKSKVLLCGTTDAKIKLWNTQTDKAVGDINTSNEFPRVEDIVCNPNGNSFATSSTNASRSDSIVYTWNMRTLKTEEKLSSTTSGAIINSMSFNNTGNLLSTGCSDGIIRIFDIKSGSTITGWQAHSDEILSVQFCSDDNKLYSLGKDGKIYQWNIHTMSKPIKEYEYPGFISDPHRTTKISFNSDQSSFIVGSSNKYAYIYNVDQSSPVLSVTGHSGPVVSADWHPSQNIVVTGGLDQTVRLSKLSKSINNL
ncbi:hypothetical protein DICPUDRAFT_95539 [Dictyostelium purpureum]|uniref:Uncharacterized protein n=1 Tax=Dictyostelium purpureum TaxID=5786 RepID=F0ZXK9_DICPU|nr:uncharacterized protein DICPUDRAFT_95539 [Dictyostelium purpureum]EGC31308.1 hypothetical protein DICPUDRAFT_95539 [Dictyostelium purpureum]|eukprot:XP_003292152.1 hypothetical protein DICPUDRAFT_95539 [Dictyostelium purpureum]